MIVIILEIGFLAIDVLFAGALLLLAHTLLAAIAEWNEKYSDSMDN